MSENLWEGLLRDNVLRSKLPNSSVVFFGEPESGKTAVLKTFCEADQDRATFSHANTEILSYDFFEASDSADIYESDVTAPRVSIWSLNNHVFLDCLDVVLNESTIPQMMFMIAVDLSKPESCVLHAKKWLRVYEQQVAKCVDRLSANQKNSLLEKNDTAVRRIGQKNADENGNAGHQGLKWKNLGVPVVIVGCKADTQQKTDQDALASARSVLAQLRCLALHYGGTLVYTSASEQVNCEALHNYLLHRLYPQAFPAPASTPQEGIADAFIPAGMDAVEIISAAGGIDPVAYITGFDSEPAPVMERPSAQVDIPEDDLLEPEQAFLAHSQQFLDQSMISISSASRDNLSVSASGAPASSGSAAATTTTDSAESRSPLPKQGEEVNSEVVRDFFQSLLNTPASGGSKPKQSSKRK